MSKGLEALNYIYEHWNCNHPTHCLGIEKHFNAIEKELKDYNKIKARLSVVTMKIKSKIKECNNIIIHTNEEDFVNIASEIELQILVWFNDLLKEVLL